MGLEGSGEIGGASGSAASPLTPKKITGYNSPYSRKTPPKEPCRSRHEADLPAQEQKKEQNSRLSGQNEHRGRQKSY
ncbi:hypothetical protein HKBW3S34_01924 [Candidatus Hakubella thermalkaliphila]|uniref:Uncharacterized protein n=1 Tax=Candidatus Hakubella thermalkaliphila TaxID=2754717 RepID=A0A6V8PE57_9ACTN|nr:hypothetical protein HKBW3S34_01924 [Candidatus Hakubella thermalkaliphila]